ncbi:MAG: protoporphyrinogen oxidase [Ilumatobacteraceae bacterium]
MSSPVRIIVVGAGITGLTAAYRLSAALPDARITIIEADDRVGGKIRSTPFAGIEGIDEGADAFLTRVPHAIALARELGLGDALTSPAVASANVWWNGLHRIPDGLLLGMPSDIGKLARTKLLTWPGKFRAALEPILPATGVAQDSVGKLIRKRFGRQVHERLVDPLVGSIYAADTEHFSLSGVPQIEQLAINNRSLLIGARRTRVKAAKTAGTTPVGPIFATPNAGMATLTNALADVLAERGVEIRLGTTVSRLYRGDVERGRWLIDGEPADAVVLATPAKPTGPLLADVSAEAAGALASYVHAGVVMLTLAIPASDWPESLLGYSGYLVPKPVQQWVTAASFATAKWDHWRTTADDTFLLRISLGRDGRDLTGESDEALLAAAIAEVGHHLDMTLHPTAHRITRWPLAFPQYRPGHAAKVAAIEAALARDAAGVFVAGASYHGIGIPACIAQANAVADAVSAFLTTVGN